MKKKNLIITGSLFIFLILITITFLSLYRSTFRSNIPALPDMKAAHKKLREPITRAHKKALRNPNNIKKLGKLGFLYHANVYYEQAEHCYLSLLKLDPDNSRYRYLYALLLKDLGSNQKLFEQLQLVVNSNPTNVPAWYHLGQVLLKLNRYDEALAAFTELEKANQKLTYRYPASIGIHSKGLGLEEYVYLAKARIFYQQENYEAAIHLLLNATAKYPKFGPGFRLLGRAYIKNGETAKGNDYIIRAGDYSPFQPMAEPYIDELLRASYNSDFLSKHVTIAMDYYNYQWVEFLNKRILEINPRDKEALRSLVAVYLITGVDDKAEEYVKKHIDVVKNDLNALEQTGVTVFEKGYVPAARYYFLAWATQAPTSAKAQHHVANTYLLLNNFDLALKYLNLALKIDPEYVPALNHLGEIHVKYREYDKARVYFNKVLAIDPEFVYTHLNLAYMYKSESNMQAAIKQYKLAANSTQKSAELARMNAFKSLLEIYESSGNFETADKYLKQALKEFPNSKEFLTKYAYFLVTTPSKHLRNPQKALDYGFRAHYMHTSEKDRFYNNISMCIAYGELGRFEEGLKLLALLNDIAERRKLDEELILIKKLKKLYQDGKKYSDYN